MDRALTRAKCRNRPGDERNRPPCRLRRACRRSPTAGDAVRPAQISALSFEEPPSESDAAYRVDDRVEHRAWGEGTVMAVDEDRITVFFESRGYKVLSRELVEEHALLSVDG